MWTMPPEVARLNITNYQILGYQEIEGATASSSLWHSIGWLRATSLRMGCTLSGFVENSKWHFSVRALANGHVFGFFSDAVSIVYVPDRKKE